MQSPFSNPRKSAEFNDWPMGRAERGICRFSFEHNPKRGFRLVRQTFKPDGRPNAPKKDTFGGSGAIVDGSDGKTYILQFASAGYDFIVIKRSDFMHEGSVFPDRADDELFKALRDLIHQANI